MATTYLRGSTLLLSYALLRTLGAAALNATDARDHSNKKSHIVNQVSNHAEERYDPVPASLERFASELKKVVFKVLPGKHSEAVAAECLNILQHQKGASNLLEKPEVLTLWNAIRELYETHEDRVQELRLRLIEIFGTAGLMRHIEEGRANKKATNSFATMLWKSQVDAWTKGSEPLTTAFKDLDLHKSPVDWTNPLFSTFLEIVDEVTRKEGVESYSVLYDMLVTFHGGEKDVYNMMYGAARAVKEGESVPELLLKVMRLTWKKDNLHADELFQRFFYDVPLLSILESPLLIEWKAYAVSCDLNWPSVLLTQLLRNTKGFPDNDVELARILADGRKEDSALQRIARSVEKELFDRWREDSIKVDQVLTRLEIRVTNEGIVSQPHRLESWIVYVAGCPDPVSCLYDVSRPHLRDQDIVSLFSVTSTSNDARVALDNVKRDIFDFWQHQRKTSEEVFEVADLQNAGEALFADPKLPFWESYTVHLLGKKAYAEMVKVLKHNMFPDEKLQSLLLREVLHTTATPITAEQEPPLALKLLVHFWLAHQKSELSVREILKLDKAATPLWDQHFFAWLTYFANQKYPEKLYSCNSRSSGENLVSHNLVCTNAF